MPQPLLKFNPESRRILEEPNAGGSSAWSEAFSCEILSTLFGGQLLRTEMEIEYCPWGKITDYSVRLYGRTVGVSVTRAVKHDGALNVEQAACLLRKKLYGIRESSRCVVPEHKWDRQILHVFAQNETVALVVQAAVGELQDSELGDSLLMITVCDDGLAPWLFYSAKTTRVLRQLGWHDCSPQAFSPRQNVPNRLPENLEVRIPCA